MSDIEQNLAFILSSRYGKDVRQAIHDAIHDCYEDGKAGAVDLTAREQIQKKYNTLAEQIANIVANSPTGSDKDSELVDVRVGSSGHTYTSAGLAVRSQISSIYDKANAPDILVNDSESFFKWINVETTDQNTFNYIFNGSPSPSTPSLTYSNHYVKVIPTMGIKYKIRNAYYTDNAYAVYFMSETDEVVGHYPYSYSPSSGALIDTYEFDVPKDAAYFVVNLCWDGEILKRKKIFKDQDFGEKKYETWEDGKFVNGDANIYQESDIWSILYVKVNEGEMYHVKTICYSRVTGISFHDINKNIISYEPFVQFENEPAVGTPIEKNVIVPEGAKFMAFSMNERYFTPGEDYSYEQIKESLKENSENRSPLYKKKLVSTGDSLVEGAYADEDDNGEKETYAYLATKQNGMIFINDGISGSTMSNITANGGYKNGFSDQRYKNIPSDTDYLTIWFGWNDHYYGPIAHKDIYCQENFQKNYQDCTSEEQQQCNTAKNWNTEFLGTDDGTDVSTWCGSWNVVLDYLVRNHTEMKIGVMIPFVQGNSLGNDMRSKLIAICKKFSVAYLDTADSDQWPSTGYTEGLSSSMVSFYKDTRTHDGLHDNALGHRLRTQPYANFILRL